MRMFIALVSLAFMLHSCEKQGDGSTPELEFVEIKPDYLTRNFLDNLNEGTKAYASKLILKLKDGNGDLGFLPGKDTSLVYLSYFTDSDSIPRLDSLIFPDLLTAAGKYMNVDLVVNLYNSLGGICAKAGPDSMIQVYYTAYVKDFAGNKSNVINTKELEAPLICSCK
jgi:hypothetical protein